MIPPEITKNEPVRHYFDKNSGKWYFSIVDVVGIITESTDARNYWKVLKNRLKKAQNQLVTFCNQLKMQSGDGKFYKTDVADKDTVLKIIEIISPEYIPLFHKYFATIKPPKNQNMISLKETQNSSTGGDNRTYPQPNNISPNIHDLRNKNFKPSLVKKVKIKSI